MNMISCKKRFEIHYQAKKLFIISLILFGIAPVVFASSYSSVNAGNKDFKKGKFQESLNNYRKAEIAKPKEPVIHYDQGAAQYKLGDYTESSSQYMRALADGDKGLKARALYNLGNAAFKNQKTDEALEYYKKALSLNPDDRDAKYNIEFMRSMKAQQKQNQKQNKDKNDKKEKDKKGQAKQEQGRDKQDKKMSKEDAKRILEVFNEQNKNSNDKRKMALPKLPQVEQDW
jgi:Ca-activated chloride channel homolog